MLESCSLFIVKTWLFKGSDKRWGGPGEFCTLLGWTVCYRKKKKKKVLVIFCRSLLIKITFSNSLPSIKVPHKLHFWLILLVIINREHHLPDLTNVNNTMHAISCLIGSVGVSNGKEKKKKRKKHWEGERERERLSQRVKKAWWNPYNVHHMAWHLPD